MQGIGQISFEGGETFLPGRTPYDRQLLLEHAKQCTNHHASVHVALNQRTLVISRTKRRRGQRCTCGRRLPALTYACAGRTLCAPCARQALL